MDQFDRETLISSENNGLNPSFTHPIRQMVTMITVLGLVGAGLFFALPQVMSVFMANLYLNGMILFVFIIGLFACFWQVWQVNASVGWIEGYVRRRSGHDRNNAPRLLASLAAMFRSNRDQQLQIGAASSRSILDSIATRIDEARDITRYIVNLLIFLGLLGTFYGLATTVPAMVETIKSLTPGEGEGGNEIFGRLMSGLEAQLGGMGTAFSSSLLGLAGSLVVGLLELFAGHGQNRFYRELEEWLSTITKISVSSGDGDSDRGNAYMSVFAEQLEAMQMLFTRSDVQQSMLADQLSQMTTKLGHVAEHLMKEQTQAQAQSEALDRLGDSQERLVATLQTMQAKQEESPDPTTPDGEGRMRLRSIDVQLLRILEEMQVGRQESLAEIRRDLALVTQSIKVASGQEKA